MTPRRPPAWTRPPAMTRSPWPDRRRGDPRPEPRHRLQRRPGPARRCLRHPRRLVPGRVPAAAAARPDHRLPRPGAGRRERPRPRRGPHARRGCRRYLRPGRPRQRRRPGQRPGRRPAAACPVNGQLESVRMLTNHDMDSHTPFATVLIGQPTLRRMIKFGVLAALDQRIAVRYHLSGMTADETGGYIRHHLQLAGATATFTPTTPSPDPRSGPRQAPRRQQHLRRRAHRRLRHRQEDRRPDRRTRRRKRGHIGRMSTPPTP